MAQCPLALGTVLQAKGAGRSEGAGYRPLQHQGGQCPAHSGTALLPTLTYSLPMPGDPRADAHRPESPVPASHPPSSLPPHLCPQAGPGLAAWGLHSGLASPQSWLWWECVCGHMDRAEAVLGGGTYHPPPGAQSARLSALLTPALHLGKGGSGVREGGARKRFLPETEETWELGNGKGQGPPSLLKASCPLLLLQPTPGMGINRDFALSH